MAPSQRCHIRSVSLPSRSHPVAQRLQQELQELSACVAAASATAQMLPDALKELAAFHESVEELLRLPCSRQSLASEKKRLESELDKSIRVLDICGAMKESLTTRKEHVKDLQSALRRRDGAAIGSKANAYASVVKKAEKHIKKCFASMKKMDGEYADEDCDLPMAFRFLIEVKMVTFSLLQLVSSSSPMQTGARRTSRWSLVSKTLGKKKVASGGEHEQVVSGEEEQVLFSWNNASSRDVDEDRAQRLQSHLEKLEISMEELENGLECLFRQLIQSRVSILNILSS